jgi:redox-sensitive bicupin YhaK (pirin superfamily)
MNERKVITWLDAQPASDGAGVKLHRVVGPDSMRGLDPFLLLDEFRSDDAADYIGGFPPHPHRGFETVTYMLEGAMRHEDHLGNRGRLVSGGAQWMTAGRGVIHSEMPEQDEGRMHGFQLWINLPAAEKMKDPGYRDIAPDEVPEAALPGGGLARVIAGRFAHADGTVEGAVTGIGTDPLYVDLQLPADGAVTVPVEPGHTALLYVYRGTVATGGETLGERRLARLGDGDAVALRAGPDGGRALLLAARPLGEPVAHHGPFVMNTREEIEQAIADYREGRLTA